MKKITYSVIAAFLLFGCGQQTGPVEKVEKADGQLPSPSSMASESDMLIKQGVAYLNQSDVVAAIQSFDNAIRKNPRNSRAYMVLSETYMRMNQTDRAIDTLTALLRVDPANANGHYLIAMAYGLNGERDTAAVHAQKSVELFQQERDQEGFLKALALLNSFNPENQ